MKNIYMDGVNNKYYLKNKDGVDKLGSGGNSSVFCVTNLDDNNNFAMKVFSVPINDGGYDKKMIRFKEEIRLLSSLNHSNIVKIIDSSNSKSDNLFYILPVYKYNLKRYMEENKDLEKIKKIDIFIGVLKGLIYLDDNNIIHRDLKPENIFLNDETDIVIGDFGIAKDNSVDMAITRKNERLCNYKYAAPEQRTLGEINSRTDMYALGIMMKEFFFIEKLFDSSNNIKCFLTYIVNLLLNVEQNNRLEAAEVFYLLTIYKNLLEYKKGNNVIFNSRLFSLSNKNNDYLIPRNDLTSCNNQTKDDFVKFFAERKDKILQISLFYNNSEKKILFTRKVFCDIHKIKSNYGLDSSIILDFFDDCLIFKIDSRFSFKFYDKINYHRKRWMYAMKIQLPLLDSIKKDKITGQYIYSARSFLYYDERHKQYFKKKGVGMRLDQEILLFCTSTSSLIDKQRVPDFHYYFIFDNIKFELK